jgi:hypothetical protein
MRLEAAQIDQLAENLSEACGASARADIIRRAADHYGLAAATIYRYLDESGRGSGRAPRSDVATWRSLATPSALAKLAALVLKGRGKLPAAEAIKIAEDSGWIAADSLSPAYLNRYIRSSDIARTEEQAKLQSAHVSLRSLHPNHVHQYDTTLFSQWYLEQDGSVHFPGLAHEVWRNKPPKDGRVRVIRSMLTDHFSGAFYVNYSTTDRRTDMAAFLYQAWQRKEDHESYPFCGLPQILYLDKGAAAHAAESRNLFSRLRVQPIPHEPGNPRAKGQVENMMRVWENRFELRLTFQRPRSIAELNHLAYQEAIRLNAELVHRRTGLSRSACWSSAMAAAVEASDVQGSSFDIRVSSFPFRLPPPWPRYQQLFTAARSAKANRAGLIHIDGNVYRLPGELREILDHTIHYILSPFSEDSAIDLILGQEGMPGCEYLTLAPIPKLAGGFLATAAVIGQEFKGVRDSAGEQNRKQVAAISLDGARPFVEHRPAAQFAVPVPQLRVADEPIERRIGKLDAILRLRKSLGRRFTPDEKDIIHAAWGDTVAEHEIAAMLDSLSQEQSSAARSAAVAG